MARVGTPNLNLGAWTDNENPGAGSQTVDNTGLNGDKIKIDTALGTGHNPDGSHKADAIDGPSIKTTAVDGSSLQATGSPRKLSVKDLGIQKNHINSNVPDGDSIVKDGASGQLKVNVIKAGKILGTGTGKAVDASSIDLNGSNELEVAAGGITSAKIAHDNTRTKILLPFATDPATGFGVIGTGITGDTLGIPMPRAGCITAVSGCASSGAVTTALTAYSLVSNGHFAAGSRITFVDDKTGLVIPKINGNFVSNPAISCGSMTVFVTLEIEFDN